MDIDTQKARTLCERIEEITEQLRKGGPSWFVDELESERSQLEQELKDLRPS